MPSRPSEHAVGHAPKTVPSTATATASATATATATATEIGYRFIVDVLLLNQTFNSEEWMTVNQHQINSFLYIYIFVVLFFLGGRRFYFISRKAKKIKIK
jgi:hypothetical protein